jgi:polysaccharide pyruvyl transferase WcaK-like protein
MKKVLLFGYYGEGNLGDELLLKSLLFSLSTDFEIGILSKKKDKNSNYRFFRCFIYI